MSIEAIIDSTILDNLGIALRIMHDPEAEYPYWFEHAPLLAAGGVDDNAWGPIDDGVGLPAEFKTLEGAESCLAEFRVFTEHENDDNLWAAIGRWHGK